MSGLHFSINAEFHLPTSALGNVQQARVIVNNALKLYSQDKTGMVDFALESGGK